MIVDPVYGYQPINVEAQLRTPSFMLNWVKVLVAARKKTASSGTALSASSARPGQREHPRPCAGARGRHHTRRHNLSGAAQPAELDLREWVNHRPLELLGESRFPAVRERPYFVSLAPYGYYWFRLEPPAQSVSTYGIEGNPL